MAFAEANGKIYLLGGYPARRITARTVQVYDIANDRWELGPQLPLPNNHGMAAGVHGKIYLIGGQTTADDPSYVDTVWELDPATVPGLRRRRCPRRAVPAWQRCTTARSTWPADVRRGETTSPCTTPGLRSLYFLLADVVHRFMYLKYGLAAVLVFVGAKMMLVDVYKVPVVWSLAVISLLIGSAIAASLLWSRGPAPTMSGRASGTSRRIIGSARMSRS